jgi:hypothetical protein
VQEWVGRVRREVERVGFHCRCRFVVRGVFVEGLVEGKWATYDFYASIPGARAERVFRY